VNIKTTREKMNMWNEIKAMAQKEKMLFVNTVKKPIIGRFQFADGHIEDVRTIGRFNLLNKAPDVKLIEDLE